MPAGCQAFGPVTGRKQTGTGKPPTPEPESRQTGSGFCKVHNHAPDRSWRSRGYRSGWESLCAEPVSDDGSRRRHDHASVLSRGENCAIHGGNDWRCRQPGLPNHNCIVRHGGASRREVAATKWPTPSLQQAIENARTLLSSAGCQFVKGTRGGIVTNSATVSIVDDLDGESKA